MSTAREYVTGHNRLPREAWLERFRAEGFTVEGEPADRPAEPLTLYRGCMYGRRFEMSWTTEQTVAMRWASAEGQRNPVGRLYVIDACPPEALLATWQGRHEVEVMIDTSTPSVARLVRAWTMAEIKACPPMQRSTEHGMESPQRVVVRRDRLPKQKPRRTHARAR